MTNNPEFSSQEQDWEIPKKPTERLLFDKDKLYTPAEFLSVLRNIIAHTLEEDDIDTFIYVLEHWEKRVLDFLTEYPDSIGDTKIGFDLGEDNIMRIYFSFST